MKYISMEEIINLISECKIDPEKIMEDRYEEVTTHTLLKKPDKFGDFPDDLIDIKGMKKLSVKHSKKHFEHIINGETRIIYANMTALDFSLMNSCDYCRSHINDTDGYYRCTTLGCNKDMCNKCYEEKTEEIALKNGAKNWHKRSEKILQCHNEHRLVPISKLHYNRYVCDGENCKVDVGTVFYNKREADNFQLCESCFAKIDDQKEFDKIDCTINEYDNFGSIFDWVPIYMDESAGETQSYILYNINPNSKSYKQYVLSTSDDHGREGYGPVLANLEDIKEKLEEYLKKHEEEFKDENDWEAEYNKPVKRLMKSYNIMTHYG